MGQPVTVFVGEGMTGSVLEVDIACRRRELKWVLQRCSLSRENSGLIFVNAKWIDRGLIS
jgi:hypothetical protein